MKLNKSFNLLLQFLNTNIIVACAYFLLGYLGTLLNTPPSNISPIWPASGLALATLLVCGKRIIPGIFIGSLAIKIYSFVDFSTPELLTPSLIASFFGSIGSCVQAMTGARLIIHFLGKHNPLIEDSNIFTFFILGGPISCLIAPTLGISTIFLLGFISSDDFLVSWCTWWIGDSIGVIIFTPLILSFIARPQALWKERRHSVAFPLLLMLLVVIGIFQYSQNIENSRIASIFNRQVNSFHSTLANKTQRHVEINQILKGFFDSSLWVTKQEFFTLTQPIISRHQSIQALEWISFISSKQREQFENPDDHTVIIREPNHQKKMIPAAQRMEYFPITYIQPIESNQRALGFDVSSNSIAFRALQKARDTGQTTASAPLQLIQDLNKKTGVVIYSPVYFKDRPIRSVTDKRKALQGFTAVVVRIKDVIIDLFSFLPDIQLLVKIEDQGEKLFSNYPNTKTTSLHRLALQKIEQISLVDRIWTITYQPSADFFHHQLSWTIWWILLGGFCITSLTAIGLLMLTGRTLRTEELVRKRTQALAASEEQFRELVQAQSAIVWRGDPKTFEFTFVSNEAEKILGYPVKMWLNDKNFWVNHMHKDDQQWTVEFCAAATQQLKHHEFEYRMINKEGEIVWLRYEVNIIVENGKAKEMIGVMIDITDRKNAEEKIKLNELKYLTLFKNAIEACLVIDLEKLRIIDANENAQVLFGIDHKSFHHIGPLEISPETQANGLTSVEFAQINMNKVLAYNNINFEWTHINNEGKEILCEIHMALLPSLGHKLVIASIRDITEQRKSEQEVYQLAFYDSLTGLANRRLLLKQLNDELAVAKTNTVFGAILFLDLDRFKILNDSLGHYVGDELLIQVAKRINKVLQEQDLAARFGGDEFIILIRAHKTCLEKAYKSTLIIAENIRHALEQSYSIDDYVHHCSTSIGITLFPEHGISASEILQQADKAMYQSKQKGGNSISFFHPDLQKTADAKLFMEKEIRLALQNQDFILFYQPQTDSLGIPLSSETLIRWHHPQHGLISPSDFIPFAEESSLIFVLGYWVLDQACAQMRSWLDEGLSLQHISVNVSAKQFRQVDFITQIEQVLDKNNLLASHLFIELTEGVVVENLTDTIEKMQLLKKMGVRISIDDFGTGYSSLSYLKQLPIDQLKIDQSFVRDITTDSNNAIIVETIIKMAHDLHLDVIAEGVETLQQKNFLISKGCSVFQGSYFCGPLSASQFKAFVS